MIRLNNSRSMFRPQTTATTLLPLNCSFCLRRPPTASAPEPSTTRTTHGPVRVTERSLHIGEIRLERGAGASGTVVFADGRPRGGVTVVVVPIDSSGDAVRGKGRYVPVTSDGRFEFFGLEAGRCRVEVFGASETHRELDLEAGEIERFELRLGSERLR